MELGLKGKVAVVTGAGRGIGRAVCLDLAREGAKVVAADMDIEAAESVSREVKALHAEARAVRVDVTDIDSVKEMISVTCREFYRVDILVNSAGIISISKVADLRESAWDKIMEVNAKGVFLVCQAVLGQMISQGSGRILNIASQAGKTGFPYEAHYSASKGAVIAFTQALAREVAQHGIHVNAVCPGSIETEMNVTVTEGTAEILGISSEEKRARTISATPLARKGTPSDVAGLITFLVSEKADFMTGQAVNITGGREFH